MLYNNICHVKIKLLPWPDHGGPRDKAFQKHSPGSNMTMNNTRKASANFVLQKQKTEKKGGHFDSKSPVLGKINYQRSTHWSWSFRHLVSLVFSCLNCICNPVHLSINTVKTNNKILDFNSKCIRAVDIEFSKRQWPPQSGVVEQAAWMWQLRNTRI